MSFFVSSNDVDFLFGKSRAYGDRVTLQEIYRSFSDFSREGDLLVLYKTGKFPITHSFFEEEDKSCSFVRDFFGKIDFDSSKFLRISPGGLRDISVYFSEKPGERLTRAVLNYKIRVLQEQNV